MKPLVFAKQALLNQVGNVLADKETFNHFKGVVTRLEGKDLTGPQKKTLAISELEDLGVKAAGWIFNVLLELAVAYLRVAIL